MRIFEITDNRKKKTESSSSFYGTAATTASDNVVSPVGSVPQGQRINTNRLEQKKVSQNG